MHAFSSMISDGNVTRSFTVLIYYLSMCTLFQKWEALSQGTVVPFKKGFAIFIFIAAIMWHFTATAHSFIKSNPIREQQETNKSL